MKNISNMIKSNGVLAGVNPVMAIGSAILVTLFVLFTVIDPKYAGSIYTEAKGFIASNFAWYYIGLASFFLFLSIYTAFSLSLIHI